jgi:hypothetical protein
MEVGDKISHFLNVGSIPVEDELSIWSHGFLTPLGAHLLLFEYDAGTRACNLEDKLCRSWELNHGPQASASKFTVLTRVQQSFQDFNHIKPISK